MATVLCTGSNRVLMKTRQLILEYADHTVVPALTEQEIKAACSQHHFDVAVLGQSSPYWLGFIFQRPEGHCIHHQKGVHAFNYSDLPLWDMMFGTFRSPRQWNAACGFDPAHEQRFGAMLLGRDVNAVTREGRSA